MGVVVAAEAQVEEVEQYSTPSTTMRDSAQSQPAIHSQHNGPLNATLLLPRLPWQPHHLPVESSPQSKSQSTHHPLPCPSIELVHPQAPFPSLRNVRHPIVSTKQPVRRHTLAFPSTASHPHDQSQPDMLTFDQKQDLPGQGKMKRTVVSHKPVGPRIRTTSRRSERSFGSGVVRISRGRSRYVRKTCK